MLCTLVANGTVTNEFKKTSKETEQEVTIKFQVIS
jgi:hypothetical protein